MVAIIATVAGFLWALLIEPVPIVKRALDLQGSAGAISMEALVLLGKTQLLLAMIAYGLAYFEKRFAITLLAVVVGLSVLTHLFGGMSVSIGFVSLAQYVVYVAEGFMLALLLLPDSPRNAT